MIPTIAPQRGVTRLVTLFAGAVAALLLALYTAAVVPTTAHADPELLDYSADGTTWGGLEQIPALSGDLAPGAEATTTFHAANNGTEGGQLRVFLGSWTAAENMQAYVRAEINDVTGAVVDLVNDVALPGTELNAIHLAPGESAKVMLVVGMPADADPTSPTGPVDPAFSVDFELDAPTIAATTTAITGVASSVVGAPVELTATIDPVGATGTVQFKDGDTDIGGPVTVTEGIASLSHTFTTSGVHSVTAVYSGDAAFATSTSAAHTVAVAEPEAVPTSITISGATAANKGTNVRLTAAVLPNAATGSVQFRDNGAVLGAPVPVVNGVATVNRSFNVDGEHVIVAEFLGSTGYAPSVSALHTVTVTSVTPEPGGTGSSLGTGSLGG